MQSSNKSGMFAEKAQLVTWHRIRDSSATETCGLDLYIARCEIHSDAAVMAAAGGIEQAPKGRL